MRLLTRSDFDGLACAVLLVERGIVDDYQFVHPKDVQDGLIKATANDVLANIPLIHGCGLWFDHHASEDERLGPNVAFEGACRQASSAAQVIWDYYGGVKTFGERFLPLLTAVNKSDSGNLTVDEILRPSGWVLLSFIMDPRTGLGRFKDFKISNYQLMLDMIQHCRVKTIEEILVLPDVRERVEHYFEQQDLFTDMLNRCCRTLGNVIVSDLRNEETIYCGNRFAVYALHVLQNVELRVMWGKDKQNVVFTCGHSIINRTAKADVGSLMLEYGGGGHPKVGTCQVPTEDADRVLEELVARLAED